MTFTRNVYAIMTSCIIFQLQELIGTAISLINIFGLRRKLLNVLKYVSWSNQTRVKVASSNAIMTIHTECAFCSSSPVLPYTMGCSHIFCYYCLMVRLKITLAILGFSQTQLTFIKIRKTTN